MARTLTFALGYLRRGIASNFIGHAVTDIRPGDKVVLWCRVSMHTQARRGNLAKQEAYLRRELEKLGAVVIAVYYCVGSGWDPSWLATYPNRKLNTNEPGVMSQTGAAAVVFAKQHGARIVATTVDRLARSPHYHSVKHKDYQVTEAGLTDLAWWAEGVPLVTLLDPDALPHEVRAFQGIVGQLGDKRCKGGRPRINRPGYKKQVRLEKLPRVLRLHQSNWSLRNITTITDVPLETVRRWVVSHFSQR